MSVTVRALALAFLLPLTAAVAAEPSFEVADQNEKTWTGKQVFGAGAVLVIGGAQRKSTEFTQAWVAALKGKVSTPIFGLANLDGLPFFIPKGAVRKEMRERLPATPLLCDYNGKVSQQLGFPEANTVRLYGPNATVLLELKEEASPEGVEKVLAALPKAAAP
jgi:hypothetical protein